MFRYMPSQPKLLCAPFPSVPLLPFASRGRPTPDFCGTHRCRDLRAYLQGYKGLFAPLLMPPVWERKGNVPAVTRLLQVKILEHIRVDVIGLRFNMGNDRCVKFCSVRSSQMPF